jgi:hypothetical protein
MKEYKIDQLPNSIKGSKNKSSRPKTRGFGYQVLGFGSGGIPFEGMTATGGNCISTVGDFKVHIFTSPGTFEVTKASTSSDANEVQYLVVAGGGGMGYGYGGAGGAGGYRAAGCGPSPLQASNIPTPVTTYPIAVGAAGAGSPVVPGPSGFPCGSSAGGNTTGLGLTATGGGGGASGSGGRVGKPGGSGSGAATAGAFSGAGGTGNQPPVSPPQGNPGEPAPSPQGEGNQGGGAVAAGTSAKTENGAPNSIDGTPRLYASGGRSASITPRANSGFGGTEQAAAGCSGIVVIKYRIVEA